MDNLYKTRVNAKSAYDDINNHDSGLKDRTLVIEGQINTESTGILDRLSALDGQINAEETGLVDLVAAITEEIHGEGGIIDRLEALENPQ